MHSVRYLFVHDDASQPTEWGNLKSPGRDFVLNVQDPNKAVISLSYELYTYLVCTKLLSHRLGAGYPAAKARLDKGEVASNFTEAESKALHDVFNDVTAIMEFSLNKLTAYAEDSISDIMRFVRFSAAYYLGIDRNPNSVHTSGKTLNTAFFSSSQLRAIPSIRYGNEWASGIEEPISVPAVIKRYTASAKGEKNDPSDYFSVIRDTVEMNLQSPTLYVDVDDAPFLEGICWNSIQKSQVPCSHHVVPLMYLPFAAVTR